MKLLCLSNDDSLQNQISQDVQSIHWTAIALRDWDQLAESIRQHEPDILLVEADGLVDLARMNGSKIEVECPAIFLYRDWSGDYLLKALESGANGFIPRDLLSARYLEAWGQSIQHLQQNGRHRIHKDQFQLMIDSERCAAEIGGEDLDLTLTEFKILRELTVHSTEVVPRFSILTRALGNAQPTNRSLDVHVCALRKKVRTKGLDIESVRGVGYRLTLVTPPPG